jgi:hypothetical protein
MNYWIFKVKDDSVEGERITGIEVYNQRMRDNFWGLNEEARNLSHLQIDDKIVFYLAGNEGHKFLGTASLASNVQTLTEEAKVRLWHGKFFRPKNGVELKQVDVWSTPKLILPLIESQALSFIKTKNNWGAFLQGSVQPINFDDYNTIVRLNNENEESVQSSNIINGMLDVIEDKNGIDNAQAFIERNLSKVADRTEKIWVGYQGGNHQLTASWNKKTGIWWINSTADGNRYWNAFGVGEPHWGTNQSHNITCEINPPFEGINRTMAGVYAADSTGKLYLLHRGKIGGGKPGNSKTKFEKEYRGNWIYAQDGDKLNKFALIACFESPRFIQQVADFVYQVEAIKNGQQAKGTNVLATYLQKQTFSPEFEGRKSYNISQEVEAACDHGIVTNSLADTLKRQGVTVGSNHQIDLYTMTNNSLTALFEVKTAPLQRTSTVQLVNYSTTLPT